MDGLTRIPAEPDASKFREFSLADPRERALGTSAACLVLFFFIFMHFSTKILSNNRFLLQNKGLMGNPGSTTVIFFKSLLAIIGKQV